MEFLGKECSLIEKNCYLIDIVPVEKYPEVCVCVEDNEFLITIFDGGSLLSELRTIYDFKSPKFRSALIAICKKHQISTKNEVIFLECEKKDFEKRLEDFVNALNAICSI